MRFDIFCEVIDNFGDAGVAWRLARQLVATAATAVRLWIDDLSSLNRLCPAIAIDRDAQEAFGVEVRRWPRTGFPAVVPYEVIIEAFGCRTPDVVLETMAAMVPPPVWLNLEYLSAETWVEGCHTLPSPHPVLPLTKYFFFPGFTERTGGLLRERDLSRQRDAWAHDSAERLRFADRLGIPPRADADLLVSLFCYDNDALPDLLRAWETHDQQITCLVAQGSVAGLAATLGLPDRAGASLRRGALSLHVVPFVEQDDYDRLLWSCDINFVRGEDSFLRAQWAARPLVWQAYPQQDDAHRRKVEAFLRCYCEGLDGETAAAASSMFESWNGSGDVATAWPRFAAARDELARHALAWDRRYAATAGLAENLERFCRSKL